MEKWLSESIQVLGAVTGLTDDWVINTIMLDSDPKFSSRHPENASTTVPQAFTLPRLTNELFLPTTKSCRCFATAG
jgi:hypothetical protein